MSDELEGEEEDNTCRSGCCWSKSRAVSHQLNEPIVEGCWGKKLHIRCSTKKSIMHDKKTLPPLYVPYREARDIKHVEENEKQFRQQIENQLISFQLVEGSGFMINAFLCSCGFTRN